MNIKEMHAVVRSAEAGRIDPEIVIEFGGDDGTRSPIILKVASRTGVDPKVRGPIVVEDCTAECEYLSHKIAELWNAEVDRLNSLLIREILEEYLSSRGIGPLTRISVMALPKFLGRHSVNTVSDFRAWLDADSNIPAIFFQHGQITNRKYAHFAFADAATLVLFFDALLDADVDFGVINCGRHGVFCYRELNDSSKD
jgi:hypothetical protein